MLFDHLHNEVKYSRAISPAAATTDNTAFVSQILDTNGFLSHELIGLFGSVADADCTFTVLVEDGDASNLSDAAAVADEFLLGVEAMGLQFDSDNKTFKIGYTGPKRYVRVTITPANNTGNVFLAAVWAQANARKSPYSTQVN